MLAFVASQIRFRMWRALALFAGLLVAVSSFTVLTAATETSRLEVSGAVEGNFRTTYDILVRPVDSQLPRELESALVRPNFLSDNFGGITLDQVSQIGEIPGIEVAAPNAMVGFLTAQPAISVDISDDVPARQRSLYRISGTRLVDGGLTRIELPDTYTYFTPNEIVQESDSPVLQEVTGEELATVCEHEESGDGQQNSSALLRCSDADRNWGRVLIDWPMTYLVAAVDPQAEADLVGLDEAIVEGEYLPAAVDMATGPNANEIPVLRSSTSPMDAVIELTVESLPPGAGDAVPGATDRHVAEGFADVVGDTVWSGSITAATAYEESVSYVGQGPWDVLKYWIPGPVAMEIDGDALTPRRADVDDEQWENASAGLPAEIHDVAFRSIRTYGTGSPSFGPEEDTRYLFPTEVGVFDPALIEQSSGSPSGLLSEYVQSGLSCSDGVSCDLLDQQVLLPNGSPAGYLQQAPTFVTSLDALPAFYNAYYGRESDEIDAPVSAVRVRVAGIDAFDSVSRERVRVVAERIAADTGLAVDVTMGSSLAEQAVHLPAGDFGRPPLSVTELWSKKGVAAEIVNGSDRKSVLLFALIVTVCALFLGNAAMAAVRSRRVELATLSALGWSRGRLFAVVLGELTLIGLAAGVVGALLSWMLIAIVGLGSSSLWWVLAIPAALAVSVAAGIGPAWLASRATPIAGIQQEVSGSGRAGFHGGMVGFALANLMRRPGRAVLGMTVLAVAAASTIVLTIVLREFQGVLVGSFLGEAISVQIRPADVVGVGVMIVLATIAVADVLYLNVRDRASELATLHATGWHQSTVNRLLATEALILGTVGAGVGTFAGGLLASWLSGGLGTIGSVMATSIVAGAGTVMVALIALVLPIVALRSQATAHLLAED